jgi:CelD/BcsL family acetyltransferase involved in cellulose biosynthesis
VLHFPLGATELAAVIPANLRQNLRYYRARAERLGTVRIERADASNFDELFATLLNLHAARWSAAGQTGVLADTIARQFHHDAARELLRRGLLRLCVLSIGDRAGAALYALCGGGETCFYLGGYDPEFRALSLGSLVIAHAVAEALAEGAAAFNFLRGREPYKYRWGAVDRLHYRRQIFSRG